jgi:hypothetical protein
VFEKTERFEQIALWIFLSHRRAAKSLHVDDHAQACLRLLVLARRDRSLSEHCRRQSCGDSLHRLAPIQHDVLAV